MKKLLDPATLDAAMDKVHRAGMPGVFAEVRDGDQVWRGAAGVADVSTGRPATPDMRHRVGSITKTFTAAAVMHQVERGQAQLDAPVGHYLPRLVPGERGQAITVRMLLNHTSHSRQGMGGSACRCHMASQQAPSAGNYALPNTALVGSPPTKPVSAGRAWRV